jgi:hypothetical protein
LRQIAGSSAASRLTVPTGTVSASAVNSNVGATGTEGEIDDWGAQPARETLLNSSNNTGFFITSLSLRQI